MCDRALALLLGFRRKLGKQPANGEALRALALAFAALDALARLGMAVCRVHVGIIPARVSPQCIYMVAHVTDALAGAVRPLSDAARTERGTREQSTIGSRR